MRATRTFRREHRDFREIPIWYEIETNARFDGDLIQRYLTFDKVFARKANLIDFETGDLMFPSDPSGRIERVGVVKTYPRTISYVVYFNDVLRGQKLKILNNFTTSHHKLGRKRVLREARDELERFVWPDMDSENTRYRHQKITGKVGGKNDDNAIAWQMIVYYSRVREVEQEQMKVYNEMYDYNVKTGNPGAMKKLGYTMV